MSKCVLITGASRGIGCETAIYFADHGYDCILTGNHNISNLLSLQKAIHATGQCCFVHAVDFSDPASIDCFVKYLTNSGITYDLLINNAGVSQVGLLQDVSLSEWNRLFSVNVTAMYRICSHAIPMFLRQGHGKIINVSSVWGVYGASCEVAYSASKGAVNSFTKALAKELAPSHIPVNAVAFGMIDTSMNSHLSPEDTQTLIENIPAGRIASAREAAEIIYTTSLFGDYVTGQIITADGGWN